MTKDEIRKVFEDRIEFDRKAIEYNKRFLEYTNREIKRERKWCKEIYQSILDKSEKDWYDLKYISAGRFESVKLKKLYKERQSLYRSTKRYKKSIEDTKKLIEKYC